MVVIVATGFSYDGGKLVTGVCWLGSGSGSFGELKKKTMVSSSSGGLVFGDVRVCLGR